MGIKGGTRYKPHRLQDLTGVVSAKDLGAWEVFDARGTSGSIVGKLIARDKVYGLRHPTLGLRYACGTCSLIFGAVTSCMQHRYKEHPTRPPKAEVVKAKPRAVEVATEAPADRQMTIDEVGLDMAGPALVEGVAAIVASRINARQRVSELEDRVKALEAKLASIRALTEG